MARFNTTQVSARKLPLIMALFAVALAVRPALAGADTGELDAAAPALDTASEDRDQDAAFAESPATDLQPLELAPREQCGNGPACAPCQNCVDGACIDLPVACTQEADCPDFNQCFVNKAGACNNVCKLKPGKCVQPSDCGQWCVQCQSNTCVDLYVGNCGPKAPCPSGSYCHWDEWGCTRNCKVNPYSDTVTVDSGPDTTRASGSDGAETQNSEDSGSIQDAVMNDTETKPDATATVPPMAPAPDPGCSTGRTGTGPAWLWLTALLIGWVARRTQLPRT